MKLPHFTHPDRLAKVVVSKYYINWDKTKGVSGPEKKVQDFLRPYWQTHCVLTQMRIPGSLLRIDLVNLTLKTAIEISPAAVHGRFNKHFHKDETGGYLGVIKRDYAKREWIVNQCKWKFIELFDEEIEGLNTKMFKEKFGLLLGGERE